MIKQSWKMRIGHSQRSEKAADVVLCIGVGDYSAIIGGTALFMLFMHLLTVSM